MSSDFAIERAAAIAAVRRASIVCQVVQGNLVTADTLEKRDRSPVTVADFASQAVVCKLLADALPQDTVVGEEAADELRSDDQAALRQSIVEQVSGVMGESLDAETVLSWIDRGGADAGQRFWTLDPIDGTKGFLRGEQYAVALGLIEDGHVVFGVLGCPNLPHDSGQGALLVAGRDQGTQLLPLNSDDEAADNGVSIRVSDVTAASDARFCESVESGHSDQSSSAKIAAALGITSEPVRIDSQCKYATVARGESSIYLRLPTRKDYREKIWDHAAGMIVVEEAGGKVTDVDGKPLDFSQGRQLENNRGIIATNGHIHDAVVAAVGDALS